MKQLYHAQHFLDRLAVGYGWQGRWHLPALELAGLYMDQFPEGDLCREWARRNRVTMYPTVAEALTLGGPKLAVDGVVIIGEHGEYPLDSQGRKHYPRYKWFKEVVKVFEDSGRAVPVYNDKHLSTSWKEALEMVEDSRRLNFPFFAGSSLPVTWRQPELEWPIGANLTESLAVCMGGFDSYDFHGLETAQCMSERRAGGEVGVKTVLGARGDRAWEILAARDSTRDLLFAALARSQSLAAPPGYTSIIPDFAWLRSRSPDLEALFVEHRDGFQTAMVMLNGRFSGPEANVAEVQDFTYAGRLHSGKVASCRMHLAFPGQRATLADFFNPMVNRIEQMVLTGRTAYQIERTLLTTGILTFGINSIIRGTPVATPELKVAYQPPGESQFWRS